MPLVSRDTYTLDNTREIFLATVLTNSQNILVVKTRCLRRPMLCQCYLSNANRMLFLLKYTLKLNSNLKRVLQCRCIFFKELGSNQVIQGKTSSSSIEYSIILLQKQRSNKLHKDKFYSSNRELFTC